MKGQVDELKLDTNHLRVLSSVACNEVMSAFDPFTPMSAKDVGDLINRSPASVLEHIQKLVGVGLLIEAGTRKRRSRTEQLFLPAGKIIRFYIQGQSPEALEAYMDRLSRKLKLTERNLSEVLKLVPLDESILDFLIFKTYTVTLDRERALRLKIATNELLDLLKSFAQNKFEDSASEESVRFQFLAIGTPAAEVLQRKRKRS